MNCTNYPTNSRRGALLKPMPLPYDFCALEPCISEQVLTAPYRCHYLRYAERLNDALKGYPNYWNESLCRLLADPAKIPSDVRTAVINNGGGVLNHQYYFSSMTPCGGEIPSPLKQKIQSAFTSVEKFLKCFHEAGMSVLGSGYAALVLEKTGRLKIITFGGQETDYLSCCMPLIVCDVWEHAYYLQYHSDRESYLKAFEKLINWEWAASQLERCFGCF